MLEDQLARALARCVTEHALLEPGDRVMVCLSGGKDSYTLMTLLSRFARKAPFPIELLAVHLDQGQPGYDGRPLVEWLQAQGHPHRILRERTYDTVIEHIPEGKTYCSLCSRLRRGILYRTASELGCTKIALGHHRDDIIETFFLNLFYGGKLKSMPPKLLSDDGANVVIRPLAHCSEADIKAYAEAKQFPIIPCNLCGSQDHLQRRAVKQMLREWTRKYPGRVETIQTALQNIVPSHLLDRDAFDFATLGAAGDPKLNWLAD